jgi:hypothetical protein
VIICTKVLITILITGFWIKLAKIVCICKIRWSVKDGIDREALEGIFGFFRWLINLWFILLTPSTFYYCQNLLYTTILVHHVLLYVVVLHGSHARDGWNLIQREPTIASVSHHILPYVDVPHFVYARQGSGSFKKECI